MKKKLFFTVIVFFTALAAVFSQQRVSGTVRDVTGGSIPGAVIVQKGSSIGTTTDLDGRYTIQISSANTVLQFSFLGMKMQEEPVNGRSTIDVTLESENIGLDEVVVTALGIQRDKKTLTYSSQQVSSEEMMKSKDINFMNALSGKTAGLEIKKSSSGAGGSTKTVLRGSKSLSGDSDPLYVIDGIPMINHKGSQPGMWGGWDQGDGISQINPEDIESISILKGSNAAVLYGSQGANGVIVINTKKGKDGKTDISFSSTTMFENVLVTPELQFDYGSVGGAKESWSTTKGDYQKNYVDDFFQTGQNLVNNLSINGGNAKTTVYFSYGNTSSTGIIENNKYQKNNLTFKQSTKLFDDKVKITSNIMLSSEKTNNRNTVGYYLNPLTGLYMFPRDRDFASYKENYQVFNEARNMNLQNWFVTDHMQSNPYWIINKEPSVDLAKRIIASIAVEYDITKKLKFQARGNYDFAVKSYEQKHAASSNITNVSQNGRWNYLKFQDESVYADGILTYQDKFGSFSLNTVLGASYQSYVLGDGVSVDNGTVNLLYPNEFYFQNLATTTQVLSTYGGKNIKEGVFGNAQFGYKDMLFLDLSGRNDWASTLYGTGNESYFYPAIGLTGIISEMVNLPDFISFSKVRASYTTVANEVPFNRIFPENTINASGGVNKNTVKPFTNLKPEMLRSLEIGTDWRFFDGRIGFDFTYYNINSQDQFLTLTAPSGSGYTLYYVNAGEIINKGVELTVEAEPVKTSSFSWKTAFNFSKNKNEIITLIADNPEYKVNYGTSEGYAAYIVKGGSFGDLYGYKFRTNEQGQIILDEKTGRPLKTATQEYLGNMEPDWSLGWNNSLSYNSFSLSFLINSKIGGKVVSQTEAILDGAGVSKRTADSRDLGYVEINGIKGTTPVTQIDPKLYYTSIGDRIGILEPYVYDRTNIRLSQLAFTYDFDMKNIDWPIKAASVSLVGQNLFFIYKNAPFDPELAMSTSNASQSLDNFNLPSTRTYGFNLKITF
jgi:TonB-linked SusC/RagA family outer membrane protein